MLTLRRICLAIGVAVIASPVFLGAAVAHGQGYPPPVPPCIAGDVNAGSLAIGQQAAFLLCGPFAGPGISVSVNGTLTSANKTAVNGQVRVTVTRISVDTVAVDDPVNVATVCGSNSVTATGNSINGTSTTANGTFTVLCSPTTNSTSGLAFTGANVVVALVAALGLIIFGGLLVVFQRRRRRTI